MARVREQQFERHMSDSEALMWNLEKDPTFSSWFASITLLDRTPSIERLRARLAHAVKQGRTGSASRKRCPARVPAGRSNKGAALVPASSRVLASNALAFPERFR